MRTVSTAGTLLRLLVCALAVAVSAAGARAEFTAGGLNARSMVFQDASRIYDVWVPSSYDGSVPVPLVIDLHGWGSNKTAQRFVSGMDDQANLHNFIVAYPQGLYGTPGNPEGSNLPAGPSWNGVDLCCGEALNADIDDVGFLRAVVADISREANVDARRVYATGLSNGGAMTQVLACRAAETFAAAAPMAFPLPMRPMSKCQPSRPIPVRHYAGLTDSLVPYDGGAAGVFPSAAQSFSYWHDVTSCAGTTPDETLTYGSSRCETYMSCAAGSQISLCSILASAATQRPGHILYINSDLDLAADAWSFLSQFEAPAATCGDGVRGAGEECDDGDLDAGDGCDSACRVEHCTPEPEVKCRGTGFNGSRLRITDSDDDSEDEIDWKWSKGDATAKSDFGNPAIDENLWLCIYADGQLRSSMPIPAGGSCADGKPCWEEKSSGFALRDDGTNTGGITQVRLREGTKGKAKIQVKAAGPGLALPGSLDGEVVVQLKKALHGFCWEAEFREPHRRNADGRFLAVGY